jgi:hypothetical protein
MKTRSSSGVGAKIDLEFDIDSLRISDCDEESDSTPTSRGSSIIDQIKQRSTVVDDPTQGATVGKIKPQVESSKLRQLLSNINTDEI